MICPGCGKEIPDASKFCTYCGVTLKPQEPPPPAPREVSSAGTAGATIYDRSFRYSNLFYVVIIIDIIWSLFVGFTLGKSNIPGFNLWALIVLINTGLDIIILDSSRKVPNWIDIRLCGLKSLFGFLAIFTILPSGLYFLIVALQMRQAVPLQAPPTPSLENIKKPLIYSVIIAIVLLLVVGGIAEVYSRPSQSYPYPLTLTPTVVPTTTPVINKFDTVAFNQDYHYIINGNAGDGYQISISASSPVNILVMDQSNFNIYINGFQTGSSSITWHSATYLSVQSKSFTYVLPASGQYYVVLDNSNYIKGSDLSENTVQVTTVVNYLGNTQS
jgi:hypothetical protein